MGAKGQALAIAHRGFRGIVPENTLEAAKKGYEAGADMWELDVAATKDEVLVVLHDDSLVRTTDAPQLFPSRKPWTVYDFTWDEIGRLDAGSWYGSADPFGQVKAKRVGQAVLDSFKGIRVPSLEAALELTKKLGWRVNVEIKDAAGHPCDAWIVERSVELIRKMGMIDTVCVSSFNHEYLRRVKRIEPRLETGALVDKAPKELPALLREMDARSYNPNLKYLDEETVKVLRAAGFDVFVWTVNEKADMRRILDWGVTGIITDFPDRLLELLGDRSIR